MITKSICFLQVPFCFVPAFKLKLNKSASSITSQVIQFLKSTFSRSLFCDTDYLKFGVCVDLAVHSCCQLGLIIQLILENLSHLKIPKSNFPKPEWLVLSTSNSEIAIIHFSRITPD